MYKNKWRDEKTNIKYMNMWLSKKHLMIDLEMNTLDM